MKALIDTHVILWLIMGDARLSARARTIIADPSAELFLSAASYWEICIKIGIGKLRMRASWVADVEHEMSVNSIRWLPIEPKHCLALISLPFHHRDPFDRMLIAQAGCEGLEMMTDDSQFAAYGVSIQW